MSDGGRRAGHRWPHPAGGAPVPQDLLVAVRRAPGTVMVTVDGDLGPEGCAQLEGVLVDLIEGQGNRSVTVDLRQAQAGGEALAALAVAVRRAEDHGASLVVKALPPR